MAKDPLRHNEEENKETEKACAEDKTAHTLSPTSLRLIVIAIRRALLGAVKLCDQLVEQLKK
jgi:hypothetical protein